MTCLSLSETEPLFLPKFSLQHAAVVDGKSNKYLRYVATDGVEQYAYIDTREVFCVVDIATGEMYYLFSRDGSKYCCEEDDDSGDVCVYTYCFPDGKVVEVFSLDPSDDMPQVLRDLYDQQHMLQELPLGS